MVEAVVPNLDDVADMLTALLVGWTYGDEGVAERFVFVWRILNCDPDRHDLTGREDGTVGLSIAVAVQHCRIGL